MLENLTSPFSVAREIVSFHFPGGGPIMDGVVVRGEMHGKGIFFGMNVSGNLG
jgi:hypothetical protein